ncbi:MAG: relaxase domain-containing protein [Actinomycetota bacterium]|nr:relaxase domain-containing protein [Actinomycetota bacterium]
MHKLSGGGGRGASRYYLAQVAQGAEDYYAGHGERPGLWMGSAAPMLGLDGEVRGEDFVGVLEGAGVRVMRSNSVPGYDLTFRAPKSVSVVWAIAPPEIRAQIRAGHATAVGEAMKYMEAEACCTRRGINGVIRVQGSGFVAAAFTHRTSRAADPLLHTHVVVANLAQGPDGRWTALDGRYLYRNLKAGGTVYQAALRRELTERLGVAWTPVENGVADIEGVPRNVIEHFSRRREQIREHMADRGVHSAAAAEIAALETRRAKQDVNVERLREEWVARATEHGLTVETLERIIGRERPHGLEVPARAMMRELTAQASTFGRAEIIRALADRAPTGARVVELQALADRVLRDPEIVRLKEGLAQAGVTEPRFTTRELLGIERGLVERSLGRRYERVARANPRAVFELIDQHPTLSDEQKRVARSLCSRSGGVVVVRAAAGTGKTYTLDAAREAWQRSGVRVVGAALSARAALELQDTAGIASVTVAAARERLERGHELAPRSVLVIDEAAMVGTRDLAALAAAADRAHAKLVLVGDDRQLPEIHAGGAFSALGRELHALELTEVRRQREPWDRAALDDLRAGRIEEWARAYRDRGRITVGETAPQTRAALVNDWANANGTCDATMLAPRRADVRDLNERARHLLQHQRRLGPDQLAVGDRGYAVGDRVIGTRNDRDRGILNGQRGTIRSIDAGQRSLTVELDGGKRIRLDAGYLEPGHLDHGYALTAHRAQGMTVDRAFVLGSEELYREWGYTAMSRHRDEARFYLTRGDIEHELDLSPSRDPIIDGIERLMGRSRAKELAMEGLPDATREELERERRQLGEHFERDPAPRRRSDHLAEELDRAQQALSREVERRTRLQECRDRLSIFRRRDRAALGDQLGRADDLIERLSGRVDDARQRHEGARAREVGWLGEHGEEASRFVAVDRELNARDRIERTVERGIRRAVRPADPPEHALDIHRPDMGIDIDLW